MSTTHRADPLGRQPRRGRRQGDPRVLGHRNLRRLLARSRRGRAGKTSPEELIAAAHSSCFSMALSAGLGKAGTPPTSLDTRADVELTVGTGITGIHLTVVGQVEGITEEQFREAAEGAKKGCPVSQALSGTTITLDASLRS